MPTLIDRACCYVGVMPAAVSGKNGHRATFSVAVALVHGFALKECEAWPILCDYNSRCSPLWSEAELRHKLESALKLTRHPQPKGYLRGEERTETTWARKPSPTHIPALFTTPPIEVERPPKVYGVIKLPEECAGVGEQTEFDTKASERRDPLFPGNPATVSFSPQPHQGSCPRTDATPPALESVESPVSPAPVIVRDRAALKNIAQQIVASDAPVALDIETFGPEKNDALNPWRGDIRLLTLRMPRGPTWLIDIRATGYDLGDLGRAIESVEVFAHNAKFDLLWLAVKSAIHPKKVFCSLTGARLLSAGTKPGNNLDQCLERFLGIAPAPDQSRSDWGAMFLTDEQIAYATRDVLYLHDLVARLDAELHGADLDSVKTLEMELIPVVVAMEETGIAMDAAKLKSIRDSSREIVQVKTDELCALLASPSLNPGSPTQMKAALARAGITVADTKEETLQAADEGRIIPAILALRGSEKSAQQAESLLESIEINGRIHGRFEPLGTVTGRFSSKSPNLQNISRGELRKCFLAPAGSRLVVADYSQIELRAAAVIAGETKMIEAFKRGDDLHKLTAATVLGKSIEDVTKDDRQLSKAVNFGLLYGQSAKGLVRYAASSYGVTLEEDEAEAIRRTFFQTYGALRQWHRDSHRIAERGVRAVRTILGRRRLIPWDATPWQRFTALVNTPVQGGCADGTKKALLLIASRLPEGARLISTVHDEVIVESPEAEARAVCTIVRESMVEAMAELFPQVLVEVEAGICERWSQK